jgi:PAS domain S-box-containing protein
MSTVITRVELRYEQDVVYARYRARIIAELLGFDKSDQTRISTAVSEIARNVFQYGGGGEIEFLIDSDREPNILAITVRDYGKGIARLDEILEGGFASETGMGQGIIVSKRLMDQFGIDTRKGGTTIVMGKNLPLTAPLVTPELLTRIADVLVKTAPQNPFDEIRLQNRDLIHMLEELRPQQEALARVTRELDETNRGVVALYVELDNKTAALTTLSEDLEKRVEERMGELQQVNEALTVTETRYRRLFEAAQDGILILDAGTGQIVEVNPYLITLLGFSREQILGKKIWEIGLFKDIVANKDNFEELQRKEYIRYEDLPLETADGKHIDVEFVSNVYVVDNRKVIQCNIRNITDRKQAEEAKIASEIRYRRLFEAAQDGILILDAGTGQIVEVNPFLITMLGFSREEFLGKKLWEVGLFKDIAANKENFEELQRKEYIRYEDLPLETADGKHIAAEFVSNVYEVNKKKVIQCNIRNITDRKLAEEALRQKNEEVDGYFTNTLDLLCIADTAGHFRRLNKEWESALGYSLSELEGKNLLDFVHPDDMEMSQKAMSELGTGRHVLQFTNRYRHKDGSYRWIEWRSFPMGNFIYASARDVTERKKMTEQIEASLAEKETLLKEVHHRVKNNLQIIASLLNLQIRKLTDPATIEALKDSQSRVRSMALVHEHLYKGKDFAHIDLGDYIRALGTALFKSSDATIRGVKFDLSIHDIYVDTNNAIPLGLICNELITNSLKYAFRGKKGGKLSITATEDPDTLTFVVADNGVGMAPDITLENQTSLGLHLVSTLTRQLYGTVVIDRTEGTKFTFTFPKKEKTAEAGAHEQ